MNAVYEAWFGLGNQGFACANVEPASHDLDLSSSLCFQVFGSTYVEKQRNEPSGIRPWDTSFDAEHYENPGSNTQYIPDTCVC